jgi:hypothetical protein
LDKSLEGCLRAGSPEPRLACSPFGVVLDVGCSGEACGQRRAAEISIRAGRRLGEILAHKALAGRRYRLPVKLQDSYPNQDIGLRQRQLVLLACALLPPEEISFPRRCELINLVEGLKCDFPTVYVDSDLAQALIRTELPEDFLAMNCVCHGPVLASLHPRNCV